MKNTLQTIVIGGLHTDFIASEDFLIKTNEHEAKIATGVTSIYA
ncbi:MAG: hypothetical protein ACREHC_05605 [Candidatus Levyibacteriota bacterium]